MRILAVWDNEAETELISVYLGVDGNEVTICTTPSEFRAAIESGPPADIVLMTIDLPDPDSGFELFELLRARHHELPVVGACQPADVYRVVRFMANGMSAYVTRDPAGNFMFMLNWPRSSARKSNPCVGCRSRSSPETWSLPLVIASVPVMSPHRSRWLAGSR
jgi:CheY-like chemotaxis protein